MEARERLIVALDFPADPENPTRPILPEDAYRIVETLGDLVSFYKVGWPLYMTGGTDVVRGLKKRGKRVFLDLKFGDIPETVRRLVEVAVAEGVDLLTVQGPRQTVEAAVRARGTAPLGILSVTLLTSLGQADLREMGFAGTVEDFVVRKAEEARMAGADGVVASAREVLAVRGRIGTPGFLVVTPGIRPKGAAAEDHARSATPAEALRAGADYLVVGRPITRAPDLRAAAREVIAEITRGVGDR
ncbi:MAG: orotidine 5'-phosphate decarboxylase [Candidatus Binatia bacterium]|nr:MAG: orotidine 5'-phosphate decarboxylase [Candidatus Binatia bacterium]